MAEASASADVCPQAPMKPGIGYRMTGPEISPKKKKPPPLEIPMAATAQAADQILSLFNLAEPSVSKCT